jgi:hypothetical protein
MREQGEPDSLHTPVQGVGSIPSHHRSVKAAIDLYNAGGDRGRPRLEFHIADHRWTCFYLRTDFPVPPRGRLLLNVKINATMLHERLSAPPTGAALYISKIAIAITIKVSTPATATPRQTSPITLSDWNSDCLLRTAFLPRHLNPNGSRGSRGNRSGSKARLSEPAHVGGCGGLPRVTAAYSGARLIRPRVTGRLLRAGRS